jgi:hypothetical protein
MPKTFGQCLEPRSLGLMVQRIVRIGAIDDSPEQDECRIAGELVLLQDGRV